MAKIDAFFKLMHEQQASDLHLVSGQPPALRIRGDIERVKYKILDNNDLRGMLYEISPEDKIKVFEETGDVDFGYEIPGLARYRANFFMQKNGVAAVFREIPSQIMTAEQLGLPPVIKTIAAKSNGLVLVTGPTGSGKSTTLASMINYLNEHRPEHIMTIEDPIEYVHNHKKCIVNQREIGSDSESFTIALKHVLPNAMVAALTFLPFTLAASLVTLTSLDFLGLGLPPPDPCEAHESGQVIWMLRVASHWPCWLQRATTRSRQPAASPPRAAGEASRSAAAGASTAPEMRPRARAASLTASESVGWEWMMRT